MNELKDNVENQSDGEILLAILERDMNFDKNLILPILRYSYMSQNYELLEKLLIKIEMFKISRELEYYVNFYVFLYKVKSYEVAEEVDDEDE